MPAPPRPSSRSARPGICVCTTSLGVCSWPPGSHAADSPPCPPPGATQAQLPQRGPGVTSQLLPSLVPTGTPGGSPRTPASRAAHTLVSSFLLQSPLHGPSPTVSKGPALPGALQSPGCPPGEAGAARAALGPRTAGTEQETTPTTGAPGLEEPHPLTHPRPSGPGTASSCREPSQLQSEG